MDHLTFALAFACVAEMATIILMIAFAKRQRRDLEDQCAALDANAQEYRRRWRDVNAELIELKRPKQRVSLTAVAERELDHGALMRARGQRTIGPIDSPRRGPRVEAQPQQAQPQQAQAFEPQDFYLDTPNLWNRSAPAPQACSIEVPVAAFVSGGGGDYAGGGASGSWSDSSSSSSSDSCSASSDSSSSDSGSCSSGD